MKHIKDIFKISTILIFFVIQNVSSEENKIVEQDHELNFHSGMFDFSDDGKRASLFGVQHQNESLTRDSFLGTLSPVTGFMMTGDNATYAYTGVQAQYKLGKLNIPLFRSLRFSISFFKSYERYPKIQSLTVSM